MKCPYDELYSQIDMSSQPFGYTVDYFLWRTAKLKGEIAKFINKDGRILDMGGGTGIMAQFLPVHVKHKNYFNIDISLEMLKYSSCNNILASAEQIPCPDSCFDYVILSEVLEHVGNKVAVLKECHRVLKPAGLFLLTTPRTGWIEDFKQSFFAPLLKLDGLVNRFLCGFLPEKPPLSMPEGIIDEPSDEKWLIEILKDIGFAVLKQYRADNHVPWARNGQSKFWRWFADKFVDCKKYGHCTVVISTK